MLRTGPSRPLNIRGQVRQGTRHLIVLIAGFIFLRCNGTKFFYSKTTIQSKMELLDSHSTQHLRIPLRRQNQNHGKALRLGRLCFSTDEVFFCFFVLINYIMRVNWYPDSGSVSVDFHVSLGRVGGFHCQSQLVRIVEREGADDVAFG